jgi:hypothetical protein
MRRISNVLPSAILWTASSLLLVPGGEVRAHDEHGDRGEACGGERHDGDGRDIRHGGGRERSMRGDEGKGRGREMMAAMGRMRAFEERLRAMDRKLDEKLEAAKHAEGDGTEKEKALTDLVGQLVAERKAMDRARIEMMHWLMERMGRRMEMARERGGRGGDREGLEHARGRFSMAGGEGEEHGAQHGARGHDGDGERGHRGKESCEACRHHEHREGARDPGEGDRGRERGHRRQAGHGGEDPHDRQGDGDRHED